MLKQFDKKDIDRVMRIWRDNNQRFQTFISNQYWVDKYVQTRDEFINSKIYVYTEAEIIKAFIAVNNGIITNIQVIPEIQREGIGEILIQKIKSENNNLSVDVYEKNTNAVLFFKAMGFRKDIESLDEINYETIYHMNWNSENKADSIFIYFDNSISEDLINKYDKSSNIQFYNIHTHTNESNEGFNINISDSLEKKGNIIVISDYIDVRNKINSIIKNTDTFLYFDCKNDYSFLFDLIKDITKVKNPNLKIVMHTPFSVEGGKKTKIYDDVKKHFEGFDIIDVDYEAIGQNQNITFKEAFEKRDEELLKMICNK